MSDNINYSLEQYAAEKNLPIDALKIFGLETAKDGKSVIIPYYDCEGKLIGKRHRNNPKSDVRFWVEKDSKTSLYGLEYLNRFTSEYIILVEGESDTHALRMVEAQVLGVPGAKNFKKIYGKLFERFNRIYIHSEEDSGSKVFIKSICSVLSDKDIYIIKSREVDAECKDPSELRIKNKLNLEQLLQTAVEVPMEFYEKSNKNDMPIHVQIAEKLLEIFYIKFYKGNFYVYSNGVYNENLSLLENKMLEIDKTITKNVRKEILDFVRIKTNTESNEIDTDIINFKNGLYRISTNSLEEHTPEVFSLCQINANYKKDDEIIINNYIDTFMKDITSGNIMRENTLLEFVGLSMTYKNCDKAMFLLGESAGNGKSTFIELITHLFTKKNICSISIANFAERFCSAEIADKLLNVIHETSKILVKDVENFKTVVSCNEISVERKYQDRYILKPFAHHIFGMNRLPQLNDISDERIF